MYSKELEKQRGQLEQLLQADEMNDDSKKVATIIIFVVFDMADNLAWIADKLVSALEAGQE